MNDFVLITVWVSLLLMPIVAVILFGSGQGKLSKTQSALVFASGGVILTSIVAVFFRVSFVWGVANVLWLLACYQAYCLLAASCLQIRKKLLRWLALFVAAVPIVFGYALATIGRFAILFFIADALAEPSYAQNETEGLMCSVTGWGGAWGDSGYKGSLYQSWAGVPFLWREVAWISVNQTSEIVARSDRSDLPEPVHDKDFCTQLMSGSWNRH